LGSLTKERAIEIILAKRNMEANKFIKEFPENDAVKIVNGMYGPYIQIGKRNVKIPKGTEPAALTLEECLALGDAAPAPKKARKNKLDSTWVKSLTENGSRIDESIDRS